MHASRIRLALMLVVAAAVAVGLTAMPASARTNAGPGISSAALKSVRAQQKVLAARLKTVPTLSPNVVATTFTVTVTADSGLATPTGHTCADAANGHCSLRAAIEAANNLKKPVDITLASQTYELTTAAPLVVTDPGGISITGNGSTHTKIEGDGSGVFSADAATSSDTAPLFFLNDLEVTGGSATDGGGVYLGETGGGPTLVLDHVVITGNTATSEGGGIYAYDYDSLYMTQSTISHNMAPDGAGIYAYWLDGLFVNSAIKDNSSTAGVDGAGAGLYTEYGVLEFNGGSIEGNTAGDSTHDGEGGGIYDEYGDWTLNGTSVDNNTAKDDGYGGGIFADYLDQFDITGGTISNDSSAGTAAYGGGIYEEEGAQIALHGVTMDTDSAAATGSGEGGGAVYLYGEGSGPAEAELVIDSKSTISGATGSAIYGYSYEGGMDISIKNSTLKNNSDTYENGEASSSGCGGAVCIDDYEYSGANLELSGDTVTGNSDTVGTYGGGAISFYNYYCNGGTLLLTGNTFSSNTTGTGGYGGAVGVWTAASTDGYTGTVLEMTKNSFSSNSAGGAGYGGAVGVYNGDNYDGISIRSTSNTFHSNHAGTPSSSGYGGALALVDYATLIDSGSTFSSNQARGTGAYGGAVYNASYESDRYTGTTFTGNKSGDYGGAVYTDTEAGSNFDMVTIAGNSAGYYGGGVYSDSDAYMLNFQRSTISGNTAGVAGTNAGDGGGVYADDATTVFENSTVSGNTAVSHGVTNGYGGGIYADGSSLGLRSTTVSANIGAVGGGLYEDAYGGSLLGSIVSGNFASSGGSEQDCAVAGPREKLVSLGFNVLGQMACVAVTQPSDKIGSAKLAALANNGGPTKTMALKTGSPAINLVPLTGVDCPATDQRGIARPQGPKCDAGAYELKS